MIQLHPPPTGRCPAQAMPGLRYRSEPPLPAPHPLDTSGRERRRPRCDAHLKEVR